MLAQGKSVPYGSKILKVEFYGKQNEDRWNHSCNCADRKKRYQMTMLVMIIAILFASLFILIPLLEKYGKERSDEDLQKITRWMAPLMVILIIAMALRFFTG